MENFNHSNDIEPIISKMKDEQSKPFHTSLKEFQTLLAEQKASTLYRETMIPIYQVLETLRTENKIEPEEYNERMMSLLTLLQLSEDIIVKDNDYNFIAIIQVQGIQKTPIFLKLIRGLLHSENVYPIMVDDSIPLKTIQQRYEENNRNILNLLEYIGSITEGHDEKNLPDLSEIIFKAISYHELTKLINSLPSLTKHSIRISDWLFDRSQIHRDKEI